MLVNRSLFETGLFSDVTLVYKQKHTIELHSTILKSKYTWFAEHCNGRTLDCDETFAASEFKIFDRLSGSCKRHGDNADAACALWKIFVTMLSFCYTETYTIPMTPEDPYAVGTNTGCLLHIRMYELAKKYGVKDMLPLAAKGFGAFAARFLTEKPDRLIHCINYIYDTIGSDHDDTLVVEARKITKRLADNMDDSFPADIFLEARKHQIKDKMPKAGVELLNSGYKLKMPSSFDFSTQSTGSRSATANEGGDSALNANDRMTCFRCRTTAPVKDTRLCRKCMDMPVLGSTLTSAPKHQQKTDELWGPPLAGNRYTFQAGMTCTFWACIGCHRIWQGQGLRQSDIEMKECSACDPENRYNYVRDRYWVRRIHWKCGRCLTVWVAHAFERKKMDDMDKCVCCPNESAWRDGIPGRSTLQ
ncbi:hypothetical protein SLS60_004485 [Paraconiothyrium brasiliense]|uniref:BTB domain-containing protein n=1 Tax=Paraconiothyrium brasiliense TaxID=300254 RepID=A0ABR3RKH8_9PLEO